MSGRRLRRFLVLVVIGGAVAKVVGLLRARSAPDASRHPTLDGGVRPPTPSADPYQAPVVEPAALASDRRPLAPLEDEPLTSVAAGSSATSTATDRDSEPDADTDANVPEPEVADLAWVEPVDGACPDGYPVKAKVRSGIYHVPGVTAYGRTAPDRCYPSAEAAEADGLRPAKR